jgi:catechol 2,3-dioxygenase-like lactoylglutathione lyase family enzyme
VSERVLHHVDIRVSDIEASRRFYEAVLAPLGFGVTSDRPDPNGSREVSFGGSALDQFAIHEPSPSPGQDTVTRGAHVAFQASGRDAVVAFHEAALATGATSIGEPGLRPQYADDYYGAFVLDPDGNNVEAVCHLDEVRPT